MIYAICPFCKTYQSLKSKTCTTCGKSLQSVKQYKVVVWHKSKRVTKTVPTLQLAKEIEAKIKVDLVSGEYYDKKQKQKEEIEFDKFFYEVYLPYAKQNKKTWKDDEIIYRNWAKSVIGNKYLNKISQIDIEKIKKVMAENKKSPKTIKIAIAIIRHVYNIAINLGYFYGANPISNVKMPTINNKRMRFLTKEEASKLLEEAKKSSQTLYEMCALSLYCGLRFGEIANLRYSDVDLENKRLYIRDPKNQTSRVVIMPEAVKEIMQTKKEIVKGDDLVYKNKVGERYESILRKSFNRIVNKLGLNDNIVDARMKVVFHTLRHTFASWLAIQGTPIYTIKELMGHKSLSMTERYAHLIPDIKEQAVENLAKNFTN